MTTTKWVVAALVLGVGAYAMRGCLSPNRTPDEQLGAQLGDICKIAHDNVRSPVRGVVAMGGYMQRHFGQMTGEMGDLMMVIESIRDDAKHDARAQLAHDRLAAHLDGCDSDLENFMQAVQDNPEAKRIHDRAVERFANTLMIIIGNNHDQLLPMRALEPLLRH